MRQLTSEQIAFARQLRAKATDAERLLWSRLRGQQLGHRFRRQMPLGRFFADFVCLEHRLIVELDGGQHNRSASDKTRDVWLTEQGFHVIRFWNNDVMSDTDAVLQAVLSALAAPPPQPSPVKVEGAMPPSPFTGEGRDGGAA